MKIKIKKIIASILTFMMIFTQVPVNVFAETKGESVPLDITLVLDVSGSMDDPLSGGTKRMNVLKDSVYQLIDEFSTKNTNIEDVSKQNRIAIVKFAGDKKDEVGNDTYTSKGYRYNNTQVVSDYVAVQATNKDALKAKVKAINAAGATNSQAAMELTKDLVNSSVNDTNRRYAKRVVIFVTDGVPTTQSLFDDGVANNAILTAKSIKEKAFIYSIGLSANTDTTIVGDDGDGNWETKEKFNAYLHGISSNYPNATDYKNLGNKLNGANYYRGVKSSDEARDTFAEIIRLLSNMLFDLADYTKVNEAKAKVPSNLNIYTEETVNALQEALDAVEEGKNITEQETVDNYAKAITDAINGLVLKDADYTLVDQAIDQANNLVEGNYKDYTKVKEAIAAVERNKKITEQTEVDAMANAINEAISKLVLKDADYTSVDQAIAQANNLVEGNYKDYTKVKEAIAAVERNKKITEQTEVDAMANAINEAISKLVLKDADYTSVDQAIAQANNLVEGNYKDYTKVKEAIAAVERNKKITEQTEVDAMANAINEAISKLVLKDANYTKVNEAKGKVPSNLNIYTEKTVNALQDALAAVEEGKNITEQETVDGYAKAINEAISKLVLKDANYTKVNEARAKVPSNLNIYTEETVNALQDALAVVKEDKKITEQAEVDAMAKAINEAISNLVLKDANYSKVNEAKSKVPSDLSIYTEKTVKALEDALAAVKEDKKITEQETVDGYAKAINEAINSLVIKDTTSTKQEAVTPTVKVETTNKETVKAENKKEVKKVKTGDSTNSVLYLGLFGFSLLIIYCIVMKKIIK